MDSTSPRINPELQAQASPTHQSQAPAFSTTRRRYPQVQASSCYKTTAPIHRLPVETTAAVISLLYPADSIHLARSCRHFGAWAGDEAFNVDCRHGDRKALAFACKTGNQALAQRALSRGVSATEPFPDSEMSPLHLAVYYKAPQGFIKFLVEEGSLPETSINESRLYMTRHAGATVQQHQISSRRLTPLQMTLLAGLGERIYSNAAAFARTTEPGGFTNGDNSLETATVLVNAGAKGDVVAPNDGSDQLGPIASPLMIAMILATPRLARAVELAHLIIDKGAYDRDNVDQFQLLHIVTGVIRRHGNGAVDLIRPVLGRLGITMS